MKATNLKKVLVIVNTNKKLIGAIFIGIMVIYFGNTIYTDIQVEKAKQEILNQDLKKAKAELEENKEIIFFNNKSVETKQKKNTINSELDFLRQELDTLETYDECIEIQLDRLANNQEVDLEYCEKFNEDEVENDEILKELPKPKKLLDPEDIIDQDEKAINQAIEFIKVHEGVRYTAYWDVKHYSICYGTKSYKGATATKEECNKFIRDRVQNELLRINRSADSLPVNKKVALISFFYNVGYKHNILDYARKGDDKSVIYLISLYNSAGGKFLPGLQKRRNAEIKIYNS